MRSEPSATETNGKEINDGVSQLTTSITQSFYMMRQIIIVSVIAIPTFIVSFLTSSTSFMPTILESHSDYNNETSKYLNLVVSVPMLVTIPAQFVGFLLSNYLGLAVILRSVLLITFLMFAIMATMPKLHVMFIIRVILSFVNGICNVTRFPHIAESTEPFLRGFCGSLNELGISFGILFSYVLLTYLSPFTGIICNSIPFLLGFVASFFVPESPLWLLQRGRTQEAQDAIARIIGPSRKDKQIEFYNDILSSYENSEKNVSLYKQLKLLKKQKNWKPLLMMIAVFGFREFGGHSVMFFYALTIFEAVGSSVDRFLCTIIIGVITVISTLLASFFQHKIGRRKILISSEIASSMCLFVAAIFLYTNTANSKIISLGAILLFTFISGVGMGPVPFILMSELAPCEVRFLNTFISSSFLLLFQFLVILLTPMIISANGLGIYFFAIAIFNILAAIVLFIALKETNLKTLTELDSLYN